MSELDDLEEIALGVNSHGTSAKRSRRTIAHVREIRKRTLSRPLWQRQLSAEKRWDAKRGRS